MSNKGGLIRQIRAFISQIASKDVLNNHTIRRGLSASSISLAKRPLVDRPRVYPFELA